MPRVSDDDQLLGRDELNDHEPENNKAYNQRRCSGSWYLLLLCGVGVLFAAMIKYHRGSEEQHTTSCDDQPCQHGATCVATGTSHVCACASGWERADCSRATGCDDQPCQNGATCMATGANHTCACASGWEGAHEARSGLVHNDADQLL